MYDILLCILFDRVEHFSPMYQWLSFDCCMDDIFVVLDVQEKELNLFTFRNLYIKFDLLFKIILAHFIFEEHMPPKPGKLACSYDLARNPGLFLNKQEGATGKITFRLLFFSTWSKLLVYIKHMVISFK